MTLSGTRLSYSGRGGMWQAVSMIGDSLDSSWTSSSPSSAPVPSLQDVLERGFSCRGQCQCAVPALEASFLLAFCLELGSSQGTGIIEASMRGDSNPSTQAFLQRDWFCSWNMSKSWPLSEPDGQRIFQRPPVLLDPFPEDLQYS